jgi:hypothetical protein
VQNIISDSQLQFIQGSCKLTKVYEGYSRGLAHLDLLVICGAPQ